MNGNGWKPKGMHWRTYWWLYRQHNVHVTAVLAGMAAKLGLLRERLDGIDLSV